MEGETAMGEMTFTLERRPVVPQAEGASSQPEPTGDQPRRWTDGGLLAAHDSPSTRISTRLDERTAACDAIAARDESVVETGSGGLTSLRGDSCADKPRVLNTASASSSDCFISQSLSDNDWLSGRASIGKVPALW
eukprot:CAMPEP_0183360592 /NCGR_PEP_ID=MMETSP0164_2-20130417/55658_1 /TAXON_ID=221442 /ORGANISM="Coccolithus pelagicus ssp braarudi, Strain PLY182g" /LENGTH=135 /DNA_ID=CAMNT_0025534989 /DNA_START=831 /DNA_END=1235 /DNA_ORIENTATION=-